MRKFAQRNDGWLSIIFKFDKCDIMEVFNE